MSEARLILTTVASKEEAQKIAHALVEGHAAACVNSVGPIESTYWWQGKTENANEYLLVIKTVVNSVEQVRETITKLHSYELPEFVVLKIEGGTPEYLAWIESCVK